ncbi:hypothetical protein G3465_00255 [Shewanella baltica]|uniref:hypothetical protein n=1 Tax=Shewanella baltica TaxID=62322 RepID=UPI00217CD67D|nr:hypothetical protein [Shewanella baltica]MCS6151370.1 hypothetical protein [Shewanella baltica]
MSNTFKKWKDHLLKSSLPLEQIVAEKLSLHGLHVHGEFAYLRKNEDSNFTEFSVDLRASALSQIREDIDIWSTLELLIECKYASPDVNWIFARYPKLEPLMSNCLHNYDFLSSFWVRDTSPITEIEKNAQYVVNGLAITDNFADNKRIKHGLNQLRYAVPRFLEKMASEDILSDEEHSIRLMAPILVTNAPLRLLKTSVNFEDISKANSLDDISDVHNVIYHFQQTGPELAKCVKETAINVHKNFDDGLRNVKFESDYIDRELCDSLETIAIVHLDYLGEYINSLKNAASTILAVTQQELASEFQKLNK